MLSHFFSMKYSIFCLNVLTEARKVSLSVHTVVHTVMILSTAPRKSEKTSNIWRLHPTPWANTAFTESSITSEETLLFWLFTGGSIVMCFPSEYCFCNSFHFSKNKTLPCQVHYAFGQVWGTVFFLSCN